MKKTAKVILLVCLFFVILLLVGYFFLVYYYRDGFCLNTWINGVYCTGKTVEEVNAELLAKTEAPIVIITDKNGECFSLHMEEVGYEADYTKPLQSYIEEQNPLYWIENMFLQRRRELVPEIAYDKELLQAIFEEIEFIQEERECKPEFFLQYSWQNGYEVYDSLSQRLDIEKAFLALQRGIDEGSYELELTQKEFYYDIPLNKEQEEIKALGEKLAEFQNCDLIYDMGDAMISYDAAIMSTFVKADIGDTIHVYLDENSDIVLDEEAVRDLVDSLSEQYDTYGREREFLSTKGEVVMVDGGTYGTLIDREAEVKFLMEHLLLPEYHDGSEQVHIPAYKKEGVVRGVNDIGNTYIEIDMTEQKMYYYEDGILMLQTDVVTGNARRRWDTPEGVNYVYAKQMNRILRGEGYATPVKYWMPVKGNIGIHDANWRSEFGGDIYLTNGSHGCINTPTDKMAELYDMVEMGTPVVMYY